MTPHEHASIANALGDCLFMWLAYICTYARGFWAGQAYERALIREER